ncbi:hypothetical protein [Streptomyces torulosus]
MEVHHVRQLADLERAGDPPPEWVRIMSLQAPQIPCGLRSLS